MAENQLRQSLNNVHIEGYLNKKNIEIKKDEKTGEEFIAGNLEIRINETNVVPVEFYAKKYTKEGKENPAFKGLVTAMNEYKDSTEVEGGWQNAEKVRITNGRIQVNEWVKDGEIFSTVRYGASFINRVTDNFEPKAIFKIEIVVNKLRPEIKNDEETGRGYVDGYYIDFNRRFQPISVTIGEKDWPKFERKLEEKETLVMWGDIISRVETKEIIYEADFGEDTVEVVKSIVRERLVKGAQYQKDNLAYSEEEIKAALEAKKQEHEGLKAKALFDGKKDKEDDDSKMPWE